MKSYLQVVLLRVALATEFSNVSSPVLDIWIFMDSHVLFQVTVLCIAFGANMTLEWPRFIVIANMFITHAFLSENPPTSLERTWVLLNHFLLGDQVNFIQQTRVYKKSDNS